MKATQIDAELLLVLGVAVVGFVAIKGLRGAVAAAGGAVVDAAGSVITGADDALGVPGPMGFPPGFAGTNDPKVARWIIDNPDGGKASAFYRSTATAYWGALHMEPGSGTPPPAGDLLWTIFSDYSGVSGSW